MQLLVVEDDRVLADLLRSGLTEEYHAVDVAHDGVAGLALAESGTYDALLLDVMLPDIDGIAIAQRLRTGGSQVPILMLTARGGLQDRLRGFEAGADDYLIKPFAFEELLARLRAVTRRPWALIEQDRIVVGDLTLDRRTREVRRAGRLLQVTPKEFTLLEYLMRHPGQVLSRTVLLERVWDYSFDPLTNVVDATIRRLRRALDASGDQPAIQTIRGVGYKLRVPRAGPGPAALCLQASDRAG